MLQQMQFRPFTTTSTISTYRPSPTARAIPTNRPSSSWATTVNNDAANAAAHTRSSGLFHPTSARRRRYSATPMARSTTTVIPAILNAVLIAGHLNFHSPN